MASQSSQESVTSRQGKITTIIPDRSRAHPRRRLAKRETTLRAFTFVRDWEARQSPVAVVHQQSADKSDDVASSSRSSVTISPSPQVINQATSLSSSGRPRVSPGPIIIASPSARVLAGSAPKKSSSYTPSSHHSTRYGSASISERGPGSNQSGHTTPDSLDTSSIPTPIQQSATSIQPPEDPSVSDKRTSPTLQTIASPVNLSDQASRATHQSSPLVGVSEQTSVSSIPDVTDSPVITDNSAIEAGSSLSHPVSPSISVQTPDQISNETSGARWRVSQSQFFTPGEKSMSIIAKTPKSGPVRRNVVSRRHKLVPPEGNIQQPIIPSGTKKAKVRLWAGNGRRRLATDVTDLDMVLNTLEDVTMDYKQKLESSSQRRALTKFFHLMKKELTDKIDLAQEYKVLKSALVRMTATTRKQRRKLLLLQQENARLNSHIRELTDKTTNKQFKSHEMNEISSFLSDLHTFHHDNVNAIRGQKGGTHMEFSIQNMGCILANAQATSSPVYNLKSVNDQLQQWIATH